MTRPGPGKSKAGISAQPGLTQQLFRHCLPGDKPTLSPSGGPGPEEPRGDAGKGNFLYVSAQKVGESLRKWPAPLLSKGNDFIKSSNFR